MSTQIILAIIAGYLLGSIPFGYIISKIWNVDIRRYGSGNIGATNVFRTLGPVQGVLVFTLDLLKGTLAISLISLATNRPELIILAGLAAVLGHAYPIFLKFKGGRGSATGLGILLGIAPDIFLGAMILVLIIILLTRYVSLASIITPILVTAALIVLKRPFVYSIATGIVTILIIIRHIPNIKRLLGGTENRIW